MEKRGTDGGSKGQKNHKNDKQKARLGGGTRATSRQNSITTEPEKEIARRGCCSVKEKRGKERSPIVEKRCEVVEKKKR